MGSTSQPFSHASSRLAPSSSSSASLGSTSSTTASSCRTCEKARSGALDGAANAAVDDLNRRLQETQRDGGAGFLSRTTLSHTKYAPAPIVSLRAVLANPLTTYVDIAAVLDEQIAIGVGL